MGLESPPPPKRRPATDGGEAARIEPAPARADDLPPIAAKADDLEAIKKAVDDAAAVGGGLWLSYLFVLFYLAVAAGAVTHADLFFEKPVKLPFLNIELPLLAFFFLAPLLFLTVHAYTLVHLVMLTDKAKRFDAVLRKQIDDENAAVRDSLRRQLPSNIFVQFLAGPKDIRESVFGWLVRAIAWATLVVAPVLLLLLMQIQFLPFHNGFITWTHRLALLSDMGLVWWLWRKILSGREADDRRAGAAGAWPALGLALSLAAMLFSWMSATFPGEWQEVRVPSWRFLSAMDEWGRPATEKDAEGNPRTASFRDWVVNAQRVSLHDWLFNAKPDQLTRRRFPFSSTLVLPGLNVDEGLGIDDPDKAKWHDFVFRARGRDLRGAIFDFASLPKVDFDGVDLRGASLESAQLQGASLGGAQLQGAWLQFAQLQGVRLDRAQLQGASLFATQLQGASLDYAQLEGGLLDGARLQGASLDGAQLQGASLDGAQLQGASLDYAQLHGASLEQAVLEATNLQGTQLWRTNRPTPPLVAAIRMDGGDQTRLPVWRDERGQDQPWDGKAYQALRTTIESLPPGTLRDLALEHIRTLDCSRSDHTLASCEPSAATPPEAAAWLEALKAASVDEKAYVDALAKVLKRLVCSGGDSAIHVLRGAGFLNRLRDAGATAPGLIDDLLNGDRKACPVAAALTDADRANLLQIKQRIEEAGD